MKKIALLLSAILLTACAGTGGSYSSSGSSGGYGVSSGADSNMPGRDYRYGGFDQGSDAYPPHNSYYYGG